MSTPIGIANFGESEGLANPTSTLTWGFTFSPSLHVQHPTDELDFDKERVALFNLLETFPALRPQACRVYVLRLRASHGARQPALLRRLPTE